MSVSPPIPEATAGFMHDHGGHALTPTSAICALAPYLPAETPEGGGDAYHREYRAIMVPSFLGVGWRYTLTQLRAVCDLFFGAASRDRCNKSSMTLRKLSGWP